MDTESPDRPRISKVWARNFKSMEDLVLDLSPLTVLVGPNASGKSNIADIPKFVSDAVRDGLDAALTSRGHAALKHSRRKKDISLGVEVELREFKVSYDFTIQVNANGPHRVKHEVLDLKPEDPEALGSVLEVKGGRVVKPPGVLPDFFVQAMTRRHWVFRLRDH